MRCVTCRFAELEILLGSQQHGFIDSVGFDLYSQMLQEAIEEKQTGVVKADIPDLEISLPVNAYIPDEYIRDGFQKIQMYKRVKAIESEEDYSELVDEMTDRFGDLPLEADLLLRIARIKAWGRLAGVESIKKPQSQIEVRLSPEGTATDRWCKTCIRIDGVRPCRGLLHGRGTTHHDY